MQTEYILKAMDAALAAGKEIRKHSASCVFLSKL